ncbi:MAG: hypothetical protein COS89_00580 [Deltaproteobacteria bacterium CG07_land_8_20_14_0_80_38_7]|nr:MAG: hypothetical protein COS89_00580 [Deltaproteobacteria bacterium CG07_land_8_20_14_0_80_38_7]
MIPSAADPIIAEYYLNQLEMGHEQLLSLFDISEHTPFISLRWYLPDGGFPPPHAGDAIYWPAASPGTEASTLNFIRDEESGGLTEMVTNETVIHELSHVMRDHLRLPHWMEEGLSTYAEVYATERTIHHEPIVEGTFPLGAEIEIPGLPAWWRPIFSAYDEETDSVAEERTRQRFTAMSQTTYRISSDSSFLLSVERVSSIDITIRVFHDRSFNRSTGWTYDFQTERMETGYRENHGVYIDDEFYRTALPQPEVIPYTSLDTGGSSGAAYYKSAYCFFEGIRQLYGHNVIPRFLHMVEEGRERDEMACPPNYCMLPALEAPTGADLSSYFELFDVPMSYDCYPSSQVPPVHSQSRYCPDE